MTDSHLESLYQEARSALKARDYEYAIELLKRVLVVDENYKDTSRLLEKAVRLRKLRWYKNPRLWGALGLTIVSILGIMIAPKIGVYFAAPSPVPSVSPTIRLTSTIAPPTATATPLPYMWARLNSGEFSPRDIITSIVVNPNDPEIIYIGTQNSGIYKSIDGGLSWQSMNNGINRTMISSLVIDPDNPNNLYTGTRSGRLFATHDAGNSWEDITPQSAQFSDARTYIFIDPEDPAHLYYSDSWNIFQSSDRGSFWRVFNNECSINHINAIALQRASNNEASIYISTDNPSDCEPGVYRIPDWGGTWEYLGPNDPNFWQFGLLLVGMNSDGGHVIIGMQGPNELFTSFDDGQNWTITDQQCNTLYTNLSTAVLCGGYNGLSISRDGGRSWHNLPGMEKQVTAIWASDDLTQLILGTSEGLIISSDGGKTWTNHSSGLGARRLELDLSPDGSYIYVRDRTQSPIGAGGFSCCSQNDLFYSTDGQNWELASSQGYGLAIDADGTTLYRAHGNNLLFSSNNGKTWKKQTFPFWADWPSLGLFAHPEQSGLLYVTDDNKNSLFISDNSGRTWEEHNPKIEHFASVQLFFGKGNTVYVVPIFNAFRSVDGGKTWNECGNEIGSVIPAAKRFAINPSDDNRVFIASIEKGLLYSANACQSWENRNNGLGYQFINSITIDPNDPDTIYLGTDGGAYISFNSGQAWGQVNNGLFDTPVVYSIVVDEGGNVYAATPYGIFKLERE
jgi:photosystem II stability/assembly factor-like uncharacterized protein